MRGALENQEGDSGLTSVPIDSGPEPCDNGGTVRVVGDVDPGSGRGTATVTYTNCQIGQDTLSGQATMQINGMVTFVPTDFTISFSRLGRRMESPVSLSWRSRNGEKGCCGPGLLGAASPAQQRCGPQAD